MTQFKVGDRVKLVKIGGSIPVSFGCKIGDTATIVDASDIMSIVIEMDNGPKGGRKLFVCAHEIEAAGPLAPPATIQHEVYNYTRGEPVVPEWVKDWAWVVSKDDHAVVQIDVDDYSISAHSANGTYYGTIDSSKADTYFRPFTNADWKWGMWAEYQGEKVFVSDRIDNGVTVAKPTNPYFFIPFSEITPTTAP